MCFFKNVILLSNARYLYYIPPNTENTVITTQAESGSTAFVRPAGTVT